MTGSEMSVGDEIARVDALRPHVVLLGAGASKAALPNGDRQGRPVPLLREVAIDLRLADRFPSDLQELAKTDFEAAYSRIYDVATGTAAEIECEVATYFASLDLPDAPTIYDSLLLSLRSKDAIFTFNWDPFLVQSRRRLLEVDEVLDLPRHYFLHGNVMVGFCPDDRLSGLAGSRCRRYGRCLEPSRLLFPVERKNYQDGGFFESQWNAIASSLSRCFMLSIFGYSAPTTDVEAVNLLRQGWGDPDRRNMEQTEIISRPGANDDALRETWAPFINSHHYEIHDSFYDSWIGRHPPHRRGLHQPVHRGEVHRREPRPARVVDSCRASRVVHAAAHRGAHLIDRTPSRRPRAARSPASSKRAPPRPTVMSVVLHG